MRGGRVRRLVMVVMMLGMLTVWCRGAAAQMKEHIAYWRTKYEELTPADDPLVQRARSIFDRVLQAAGTRPGVVPRLFITKRDPWGISLPIALPDGWIVLSKRVLELCYQQPAYGDDRLAFVLGHELAHQLADDFWHLKFFQALEATQAHDASLVEMQQRIEAADARWKQELQADQHGIVYAAMAGFNTQPVVADDPAVNFFQEWVRARGLDRFETRQLADSHPAPFQRAAALQIHLRQVMRQVPLFEMGLWFVFAGDYPKAIRAFEQFLSVFPSREVYHNLALSHHLLALQAYRLWRGEPALPFHLAMVLDPLTRASQIFLQRQARPLRGMTPKTDLAAQFHQHLDEAIGLYREALAHDAAYTPASGNLGSALLVRGVHAAGGLRQADVYEAVATLQRALEHTPRDPRILNNLGVALFYVHDVHNAKGYLVRARTLAPAYAAPVFNLGYMAQTENRQTEAQRYQRTYTALASPLAPQPPAGRLGVEQVQGLAIGELEGQVPASWGTPLRSTFQVAGWRFTMTTYPNGSRTLTRDGEILMLMVQGSYQGSSTGGVRLGSRARNVLAHYGPPTRRLAAPRGSTWAYDAHRIAFQLRAGKVISWLLF
jgi:tetratricopeptide (TPR) repeat protein